MAFLRELLASKPIRVSLEFGINENVRLVSVTNEERKREGEVIRRNNYMTFVKYDSKGVPIANSEFSYMNLDPNSEYTFSNFIAQTTQMNHIARVLNPDAEVDPTEGYETEEQLSKDLKTKAGCEKFIKVLHEQFLAAIENFIGPDSEFIRVKVITEKTGKYLQLPKEGLTIELASSKAKLNITPYETKMKNAALDAPSGETADRKGDAPDTLVKKKSALAGL